MTQGIQSKREADMRARWREIRRKRRSSVQPRNLQRKIEKRWNLIALLKERNRGR